MYDRVKLDWEVDEDDVEDVSFRELGDMCIAIIAMRCFSLLVDMQTWLVMMWCRTMNRSIDGFYIAWLVFFIQVNGGIVLYRALVWWSPQSWFLHGLTLVYTCIQCIQVSDDISQAMIMEC